MITHELSTRLQNIFNPLEQFSVLPAYSCFTSNFTNILIIHIFLFIYTLKVVAYDYRQNFISYGFFQISTTIKNAYLKNFYIKSKIYFPIFIYVFLIVFINNSLGLLPFSYAITSSLGFDFFIVLFVFLWINLVGLLYHRNNFLSVFVPRGIPIIYTIFFIPLEIISYFMRIISLTVRLFANILSGHILQHILLSFSYQIFMQINFVAVIFVGPWIIAFIITYLEILVAFLQAYVFVVLLLIYFNNAVQLH